MSLFGKLLSLHGGNVPLEDFFTEVVAHLLGRHPELCEEWLVSLGVLSQGSPSKVSAVRTQPPYKALAHHEQDSQPDIEVELTARDVSSGPGRVFVESKIGSAEGPRQLRRYAEHLASLQEVGFGALVYMTRDYDPKDAEEITHGLGETGDVRFEQSRWSEFYGVLAKYHRARSSSLGPGADATDGDSLIVEVMDFMEERGLSRGHRLTGGDLEAIHRLPRTLSLLEETVSDAGVMMQPLSGRRPKGWGTSLRTIREHGFYTVVTTLGPDESWWAGVGYVLNQRWIHNWVDSSGSDYPAVRAIIELPPGATDRDERIAAFRQIPEEFAWRDYNTDNPSRWVGVLKARSLVSVLPEEDHIATIRTFFKEAISDMHRIKEAYPKLPWSPSK